MSDLPTVEGGDVYSPHTLSSLRDQRGGSKREGVNLASMLRGRRRQRGREALALLVGCQEKGCPSQVSASWKHILQTQ